MPWASTFEFGGAHCSFVTFLRLVHGVHHCRIRPTSGSSTCCLPPWWGLSVCSYAAVVLVKKKSNPQAITRSEHWTNKPLPELIRCAETQNYLIKYNLLTFSFSELCQSPLLNQTPFQVWNSFRFRGVRSITFRALIDRSRPTKKRYLCFAQNQKRNGLKWNEIYNTTMMNQASTVWPTKHDSNREFMQPLYSRPLRYTPRHNYQQGQIFWSKKRRYHLPTFHSLKII